MGFSLGGSYGSTSSNSKSNSSQSSTYTPGQSDIQDALARAFKTLLPGVTGGGISPNVTALQTQNADTINKTDTGLAGRMQKFLAGRGFGSSGESGKVALSSELGRQSDLAANNTGAAGLQLSQNNSTLQQMLQFAFNQIGLTGSQSGSGSASGYSVGGGVSGKF